MEQHGTEVNNSTDKKPKTLRRKIKGFIKSDHHHHDLRSDKDAGWRRDVIGAVEVSHQFKEELFKCRMLGECVLKSLKPADCYEFALRCANSFQHKHLPKGSLILYQDDFRLNFSNMSPDNKRKTNNNNNSEQQQRPTTVFDDSFRHRRTAALRCSYSTSGRPIFCITGQSADGDALTPPDTSVPIHKVAYCGVIPERPEVFFVTSRDCTERLVCRVFIFSKRHKAREVKSGLALRFERAYREWQSQFSSCSRSSIRSLISTATSTPGSSPYVRAKKHKHHLKKRVTKMRLLHLSSSSSSK